MTEEINNILVIGNGFDLHHGLPTKYSDFIKKVSQLKNMDAPDNEYDIKIKEYTHNNFFVEYFIKRHESRSILMYWKKIFVKLIFTKLGKYVALPLYALKQPNTIFRYRTGNDDDIDSLKNEYVWLSNVMNVNDDFEGLCEIRYNKIKFNYKFLEGKMKQQIDKIVNNVRERFYIACFTENETNNKMWKDYADEGKGYCIEYYLNDFKQFVFPVVYVKKKVVDITKYDEIVMKRNLVTKLKRWSEENEWRILWPFYDKIEKGKKIKQPIPKAIYMGVNIRKELSDFLLDYCRENVIGLYQMTCNEHGKLFAKKIL